MLPPARIEATANWAVSKLITGSHAASAAPVTAAMCSN